MAKKHIKSEDSIQQECFMWHWNTYPKRRKLLWHTPNELSGLVHIRIAKKMKDIGLVPGVADLVLVDRGITTYFELKTEIGSQSSEQKDFEKQVTNDGCEYFIIRDKTAFILIVTRILEMDTHIKLLNLYDRLKENKFI